MNIGIIGAGGIAEAHTRAARKLIPSGSIGIYDISPEKASALAQRHGCNTFEALDDLYDTSDAIIIASPNDTHYEYALRAIKRGLHVLCEKPMTTAVNDADELARESRASRGICVVGFNYRFLPVTQLIKKFLDDGELGEIITTNLSFKRDSALRRKSFTWRDGAQSRATSGALGDLGSHLFDLVHYLIQKPIELSSMRAKLATYVVEKEGRRVSVDDHALVNGRLHGGVYFSVLASKCSEPEDVGFAIEVIGSHGELFYHSSHRNVLNAKFGLDRRVYTSAPPLRHPDPDREIFGWADSFYSQLDGWFALAMGQDSPESMILASFDDGLQSQAVIDDLLQHRRLHDPV
jgi:glucose-6-phosphate 3-dehydrogenase